MTLIRAFIALDLPVPFQQQLARASLALQRQPGALAVRWSAAASIHLTLAFLGEVPAAELKVVEQEMVAEAGMQPPFEIALGGVGAFPNLARPRVVWVGVSSTPEPALAAFQAGIQQRLQRLGQRSEERLFQPHLTLGRVGRTAQPNDLRRLGESLGKAAKLAEVQAFQTLPGIHVKQVCLYRSDLRPQGPIYQVLAAANLSGVNSIQSFERRGDI